MNNEMRSRCRVSARGILLAGLMLSLLALPFQARAALGGDASSVEADRQQMKATVRTTQPSSAQYTVQEITAPYGTVVREFVSPSGKVFGVAWRGPFLPNFQQIFGSYYQEYAQAAQAARSTGVRRSRNAPLIVNQSDLVVHSTGHTRAYAGRAFLPGMIPEGVDAEEIK